MDFYFNFLIEYRLIGIVYPTFTRRNGIRCIVLEIEGPHKNVRKTPDRTALRNDIVHSCDAHCKVQEHTLDCSS